MIELYQEENKLLDKAELTPEDQYRAQGLVKTVIWCRPEDQPLLFNFASIIRQKTWRQLAEFAVDMYSLAADLQRKQGRKREGNQM